jgi:hypothetical protein
MKLFYKGKDGGDESLVTGYWLIEIKSLFSIVLLRFDNGTREAFHSHAFNCFSWVLSGCLVEYHIDQRLPEFHNPSCLPFCTYRTTFHKVASLGRSWVLSFRGPWAKTWEESIDGRRRLLSHGRVVVMDSNDARG